MALDWKKFSYDWKIDPLPGAREFLDELRTFPGDSISTYLHGVYAPLMKTGYPTLFLQLPGSLMTEIDQQVLDEMKTVSSPRKSTVHRIWDNRGDSTMTLAWFRQRIRQVFCSARPIKSKPTIRRSGGEMYGHELAIKSNGWEVTKRWFRPEAATNGQENRNMGFY